MAKKNTLSRIVIIALIAAIAVVGALLAVQHAGIQQAVAPNAAQGQDQSFEFDPDNPPEGVEIIKDGEAPSSASAGKAS